MPDPRSVMKEYRYLDEKRLAKGLSAEEQARFERLRDLVGSEAAPAPRAGFDVNAAAAQLRESLLPAGLRNRPPPTPQRPPPAAPEPEPEQGQAVDALESVFAQAPFSPVDAQPAPEDALFDPASLGEAAPYDPNAYYDPNAANYDPNAPYDPNAVAAYDANAPYDPNAAAYDANAPYDPNAAAYDPSAPYDPNAAAYDPNAPYDPNAAAYDPNAPYDPSAAAAYDPSAPYDPNAIAAAPEGETWQTSTDAAQAAEAWQVDAGAGAWDPNAAADANAAEVPLDAGAAPAWEAAPTWDPNAAASPAEGQDAGGFQADAAALPPAGWDSEPQPAEPAAAGIPLGEYDETGGSPGMAALAVEEDAGLASSLPFDAAAASEVPAGALPEGYEAAAMMGEYDDTAGLTGPVPPELAAAGDELAFAPAVEAREPAPGLGDLSGWQPEAALEEGFELASGGSFGAGADAAAPEWAQAPAPPPWENAPPLDLAHDPGAPVAEDAAYYEVEPAVEAEAFAGPLPEALEAPAPEVAGPAPELDFSSPDFSAEEGQPAVPGGPGLSMAELLTAPADAEPAPAPAPGAELEALPPEEAEPVAPGEAVQPLTEPSEEFVLGEGAVEAVPAALEEPCVPDAAPVAEALLPTEPPSEEVSFDFGESSMTLAEAAVAAPAAVEEEIPTLDEADIIEEIVDDPGSPPPQSLDFAALDAAAPADGLAPEFAAGPAQVDAEPEPQPEPEAQAELAPEYAAQDAAEPAFTFAATAVAEVEPAPEPEPEPVIAAPPEPPEPPEPPPILAPPPPPAPPPAAVPVLPRATPAPPPPEPAPEPPPTAAAEPRFLVDGSHRVVVHTVEGQVKRGVLADAQLDGAALDLVSQPGGKTESVPTDKVKAIFFMLSPGETPPAPEGKKVRVTFRDGRQVAGFSPDYDETGAGFFMIPGDTRTNTGRIWVYRAAVRALAVS